MLCEKNKVCVQVAACVAHCQWQGQIIATLCGFVQLCQTLRTGSSVPQQPRGISRGWMYAFPLYLMPHPTPRTTDLTQLSSGVRFTVRTAFPPERPV